MLHPMTWFLDYTYLGHTDEWKRKIERDCFDQGYIALIEYDPELGWVFHTLFPPDNTKSVKQIAAHFEKKQIKPVNEKDLERRVVESLERCGEPCESQVYCAAGIADIVTPSAVIEVELYLSRHKLFEAIGQVLAYRQAINPEARAVIVATSIDDSAYGIAAAARQLGIHIKLWDSEKEALCLI